MTPEQRAERCWLTTLGKTSNQVAVAIAQAIREAVDEEREACAKTAEAKCAEWNKEGDGESLAASQQYYGMVAAGREIADRIRARRES